MIVLPVFLGIFGYFLLAPHYPFKGLFGDGSQEKRADLSRW